MLLPRSGPTPDSCTGDAPCSYETGKPTSSSDDVDFSSSYGFMGITIVVILVILACTAWLYLARRKANQGENSEELGGASVLHNVESKTPHILFGIGKRKQKLLPMSELKTLAPRSPKEAKGSAVPLILDSPSPSPSFTNRISRSEKGKEPRWVSKSGVRKGLVKEVSGGMVVYTTPSNKKPLRPKPTAQPPRTKRRESLDVPWNIEHVSGIGYEVRTPP